MLITLVKTVVVQVDTEDPNEGMDIVDSMDADGSLELIVTYFNTETGEQLN